MNKSIEDKKILRLFIISFLVMLVMGVLTNMNFFSLRNWNSMLSMIPELGILSLGIMLAMIVGGIDLSLVSIANVSGLVSAGIMLSHDGSPLGMILGILAGVLVGAACGFTNGFLVAYVGIHPIVATLGTYQLFRGIGVVFSKGYAIVNFSPSLTEFSNGSIFGLIPNIFIIFILIGIVVSFILRKTIFGQNLYYVGENSKASFYSTINTKAVILKVFILIGILGAIAGIIMTSKTNSAKADYGGSYTLQAILICLLGGVSWAGGIGKTSGVLLAVFTLQFLNSGFGLLRFSNFFGVFFTGLFLILVMIYYYFVEKETFSLIKIIKKYKESSHEKNTQ
jgi:simple sugar transport system permease protein